MPQEPPPGRPPQDSDAEILAVVHSSPDPVLGTREVAERLTIDIDATRLRLQQLQECGDIAGKTIGDRHIWWHPKRIREEAVSDLGFEEQSSPNNATGAGIVESLNLPGDGRTLDARREAVDIVFREIVLAERVPTIELREKISDFPERTGYGDLDGLWNNTVWEALSQAPFFLPERTEDEWVLSEIGTKSKSNMPANGGADLLDRFGAGYEKVIFEALWEQFSETIQAHSDHLTVSSQDFKNENIAIHSPYISKKIHFEYEFTDSIIHGVDGDLSITIELDSSDPILQHLIDTYHELPEEIREEFHVEIVPITEADYHVFRKTSGSQTTIASFENATQDSAVATSQSERLLQVTGTRHVEVSLDTTRELLQSPANPFDNHTDFIISKIDRILQEFAAHLQD